jgi:transcriptional regulator with XRE-family HTH domain
MNDRLVAFLRAEELSSARFADIMQIQPSGVSHLLSGRNKPGYDFFEKFLQRFPAINIEWLISGRGKMYKEQTNPTALPQPDSKPVFKVEEPSLFAHQEEKTPPLSSSVPASPPVSASPAPSVTRPSSPLANTGRHIEKIIILYNDGTFEERG